MCFDGYLKPRNKEKQQMYSFLGHNEGNTIHDYMAYYIVSNI